MSLDPAVRIALRQVLEAAAPLARGTTIAALAPPVRRLFLVRSGSASMLRDALERLRTIEPLPELALLGRQGDDVVAARVWPGLCRLIVAPGDGDYATSALEARPDLAEAIRDASHHGFLASNAAAAGYDNVFGIFAACGVTSCFASIADTGLVHFDLQDDALRSASAVLCSAIVAWTHVAATTTAARGV